MNKIIHLTDTHICPRGRKIIGVDPAERLRMVIRSIKENHLDADACVITGDLTDQGEPEAYEFFREIVADIPIPVHFTLGNHDRRDEFRNHCPDTPVDENGFVQSVFSCGGTICIIADTLNDDHPGKGLLCRHRLAWLKARLEDHRDRQVVLFMHHPPFSFGVDWFDSILLENGAEVMEILSSHANVAHIALGHVHENASGVQSGISFSASRGTCHKILCVFEATEANYAEAPPAYDVLLLNKTGVFVHSIDPAGHNTVIARERDTPDGKGAFETFKPNTVWQWM